MFLSYVYNVGLVTLTLTLTLSFGVVI